MKVKDIYDLETANTSNIYLIRDGNFLRAYEHSCLLFLDNITQYHVTKRLYKVINTELVYLGFPMLTLPKLLQRHEITVAGETAEFIVLQGFTARRDFSQWKASINDNSKEEDERNLLMQERVLPRFEDNHPLHIYKMGFDGMVSVYRLTENMKKGYKYTVGEELKKDAFQLALLTFRLAQQGKDAFSSEYGRKALLQTDVVKLRLRLLAELHQLTIPAYARMVEQMEYLVAQLKRH